jgi:hypothetical protein
MTRASAKPGTADPLRGILAAVRTVTPLFVQVTPLKNKLVLANYFMLLEIPDARVSIYRDAANGIDGRSR